MPYGLEIKKNFLVMLSSIIKKSHVLNLLNKFIFAENFGKIEMQYFN